MGRFFGKKLCAVSFLTYTEFVKSYTYIHFLLKADRSKPIADSYKPVTMNISIFGLGYVGAVSCACFASSGHSVIGVDVNPHKIDLINRGQSPIIEKDLDRFIAEGVQSGRIRAMLSVAEAIQQTELSLICVGTPSLLNGNIDTGYVYKVAQQIGEALAQKNGFHSVAIRSTVTPGTVKTCAEIMEDASGKKLNVDFGIASNPEFLREGTAIADFFNPPYTVIGASCEQTQQQLTELYANLDAPVFSLRPEESEMIKYVNNNFHALKVTFANEIGNICKELHIDSHVVMDIVAKDTKLNLSPYYLKPGFAFGGSCLPKDVRGLTYQSKALDLQTPLLNSLMPSNEYQIQRALQLIMQEGKRKVAVLGFAFKAGTDDVRESPMIQLIENLLGKGYELQLYDKNVSLSKLLGKNKDFLTSHIPHISRLLKDNLDSVVAFAEIIVIGNGSEEFTAVLNHIRPDQVVLDLVRIDPARTSDEQYKGICW